MGKREVEDIEFYKKEYKDNADEVDSVDVNDMAPHMHIVQKPNPNAWTAFILGIMSSLAWLVPIIGLPVTIVGTVLGAIGMRFKRNRGIAIAGFVINIVFLCCTIAKGVIDIVFYLRRTKQS